MPRYQGNKSAKILVICEPNQGYENCVMKPEAMSHFVTTAISAGFKKNDFLFMELVKDIPESEKKTPAKQNKFIKPFVEEIRNGDILDKFDAIIALGGLAAYAATGSPVKITQARGTPIFGKPFIFPMFGPSHAMAYPENQPIFESDLFCFKAYVDNGLKPFETVDNDYRWCEDLSELLEAAPKIIAIDTETTGLRSPSLKPEVITVQISYKEGQSFVCPIHPKFWDWSGREEQRLKLVEQISEILRDYSIKKVGHNIKYDLHVLEDSGFVVNGVGMDTELMAWAVDENMMSKSLDNCIRRWVPKMAGFNDYYNEILDKSNMMEVPKEDFLVYAGNDTSATITLFYTLDKILRREPKHRKNLYKLKIPMLRMLYQMERNGMLIDQDYMQSLIVDLQADIDSLYKKLIRLVPRKVLLNHMSPKKGLKFSRDDFVRDILFSEDGFNLKPVVFTKGSREEVNKEDRIPSVSVKEHLPYFSTEKGKAGEFIELYIDYAKTEKLLTTYTLNFDKYIYEDGKVHANFNLARTNTGRTSSSEPNLQNLPARGRWSKPYKKMFVAPEGYSFVSADLSQIELRLIAHRSGDTNLRNVYRNDNDVHTLTAMNSMGLDLAGWEKLAPDVKKLNRFRAKAVNFGFCLTSLTSVLTNNGLKRIVDVLPSDLLWDGYEWVTHDGVIYKGKKKVITYMGLTATPDHKVYISDKESVTFEYAARNKLQILQTGIGSKPITLKGIGGCVESCEANKSRDYDTSEVSTLWAGEVSRHDDSSTKTHNRLSMQGIRKVVRRQTNQYLSRPLRYNGSKVRPKQSRFLTKLQRSWDSGYVQIQSGVCTMGFRKIPGRIFRQERLRQNRQRRSLRTGQFTIDNPVGKLTKQERYNLRSMVRTKDDFMQMGEELFTLFGKANIQSTSPRFYPTRNRRLREADMHQSNREVGNRLEPDETEVTGSSPNDTTFDLTEAEEVDVYDIMNAGPRHRFTANNLLVSNCYGMWWKKFKTYAKTDYGIDYTDEECEHLYNVFFRTYPRLKEWHKREKDFVNKHGYVVSDMGFTRHLPSIYSSEDFIRKQTERQAVNAPIQHDASNIGLLGLTRIGLQDTDRNIIPVGFIHDDMITLARNGYEQDAVDALVYVSNQHRLDELCGLQLSVPLKSEPDVGKSLGSMYELADLPKDAPDWVKSLTLPNLLNPKKPSWWDDNKELKV